MADDLQIDVAALEKRFAEALRDCPEDLFREMKPRGYEWLEQWIGLRIKSGRFASGQDTLKVRSGTFRRAFGQEATGRDMASLRFTAGTITQGIPYAFIQEFGGEVVPKRAKFLTVPLRDALTAAGVLRAPARAWPDTFVRMNKGGRSGTIFQTKSDGSVVALFRLLKKVKIAGRLGFFDSWRKNEPHFIRHLADAVETALKTWAARDKGGR